MGLVPIIWTSTPDGGKFDSNGMYRLDVPAAREVKTIVSSDWRVAGGLITGPQALEIFKTILNNGTTLDTGYVYHRQ